MLKKLTSLYKLLGVVALLVLAPTSALAFTHHVVCADQTGGTATCSSNVLTVPASTEFDTNFMPGTGGLTYYISATWSVSGSHQMCAQASGPYVFFINTSTFVAQSFTTHADTGFTFDNRGVGSSGCTGNDAGATFTLSNICITDTSGACDPAPAPIKVPDIIWWITHLL